jgi:hypothetical protein
MASKPTRCPSCGSEAEGNFCRNCGASLGPRPCPSCRAPLAPGAKFCTQCGAPAVAGPGGTAAMPNDRRAWTIAAAASVVLLVVVLALVVRGNNGPATAGAVTGDGTAAPFAGGAGGTPPDISNMSPRERFDRLYNRVMQAAESGDQQTVTTFSPMAMMAYQQLDTVDADARFHMATLELHTGDVAGATAMADTLLAKDPGHLFGYVIQGTVARWQKDDAALKQAYKNFLAHYDAEMKRARPEYADHERMIKDFHDSAVAAQ